MAKAHPLTKTQLIPTVFPPTIEAGVRDAEWLAHRYDPGHDAVHFIPVPRTSHDSAIFLTDDHLPLHAPLIVSRADAIAAMPPRAPLHFIFHSAFCCSTLATRAFNRPGWAMGLKEPVIFNDIVGWRRRGGEGPDMAEVLDDSLTLLARPFSPGEAVIVKPSTIVNGLAAPMLALRPDARAILMYAPLRTYLGSVAKKELDGRLWVRNLLLGMIDDRLVDLGFSTRDYLGQSDLQVAAVGWLAQQVLFAGLIARFGPDRVRTLDSATLTARPAETLDGLASLFDMPLDQAAITEIVSGPAFNRHSKFGMTFNADDRDAEHRAAADIHADEIDKVARWIEAVAETQGVPLIPPAPLLGRMAA